MTSPNRALLIRALLVLAVWVVGAGSLVTPAHGQVDEQELTSLRTRIGRNQPRITELTTIIDDANDEIDSLEQRIAARDIEIELLADQFAVAVDARNEPMRVSEATAIDSYIQGDPRNQAALEEIRTLDAERNRRYQRRRQLFDAVIATANAQLEAAERRLATLDDTAGDLLDTLADLEESLLAARDTRTEALAERAELTRETRALRLRLEWLESLKERWVLTGELGWDGTTRPALAVKIDNVAAARPQWGVNEADIVWEEVVEGGFTRLVAVFHSRQPEVVGPVRSLRTSDPRILFNLNSPLLAHSGGNQGALDTLALSPLVDVGVLAEPSRYRRESSRPAPHNLMSSTTALWEAGGDRGGVPPPVFRFREPGDELPPGARPVTAISIDYGMTTVAYRWNGEGWERSQDGRPHTDIDGDPIAPPNLIVQFIGYKPSQADLASPEADVFGNGKAWVLMDGQLIEGTWDRIDPAAPTSFRDRNGELIPLNRGATWVALPQVDSPVATL